MTASRRASARPTRSAFARRGAVSSRARCCSACPTRRRNSRAAPAVRRRGAARDRGARAIPAELQRFARDALQAALGKPALLDRALGEYLTEPKASVWFDPGRVRGALREAALDRRTRMMYDARHVFINGESWRAGGADARLMRLLADRRELGRGDVDRASETALALLASWCEAGWLHPGKAQS